MSLHQKDTASKSDSDEESDSIDKPFPEGSAPQLKSKDSGSYSHATRSDESTGAGPSWEDPEVYVMIGNSKASAASVTGPGSLHHAPGTDDAYPTTPDVLRPNSVNRLTDFADSVSDKTPRPSPRRMPPRSTQARDAGSGIGGTKSHGASSRHRDPQTTNNAISLHPSSSTYRPVSSGRPGTALGYPVPVPSHTSLPSQGGRGIQLVLPSFHDFGPSRLQTLADVAHSRSFSMGSQSLRGAALPHHIDDNGISALGNEGHHLYPSHDELQLHGPAQVLPYSLPFDPNTAAPPRRTFSDPSNIALNVSRPIYPGRRRNPNPPFVPNIPPQMQFPAFTNEQGFSQHRRESVGSHQSSGSSVSRGASLDYERPPEEDHSGGSFRPSVRAWHQFQSKAGERRASSASSVADSSYADNPDSEAPEVPRSGSVSSYASFADHPGSVFGDDVVADYLEDNHPQNEIVGPAPFYPLPNDPILQESLRRAFPRLQGDYHTATDAQSLPVPQPSSSTIGDMSAHYASATQPSFSVDGHAFGEVLVDHTDDHVDNYSAPWPQGKEAEFAAAYARFSKDSSTQAPGQHALDQEVNSGYPAQLLRTSSAPSVAPNNPQFTYPQQHYGHRSNYSLPSASALGTYTQGPSSTGQQSRGHHSTRSNSDAVAGPSRIPPMQFYHRASSSDEWPRRPWLGDELSTDLSQHAQATLSKAESRNGADFWAGSISEDEVGTTDTDEGHYVYITSGPEDYATGSSLAHDEQHLAAAAPPRIRLPIAADESISTAKRKRKSDKGKGKGKGPARRTSARAKKSSEAALGEPADTSESLAVPDLPLSQGSVGSTGSTSQEAPPRNRPRVEETEQPATAPTDKCPICRAGWVHLSEHVRLEADDEIRDQSVTRSHNSLRQLCEDRAISQGILRRAWKEILTRLVAGQEKWCVCSAATNGQRLCHAEFPHCTRQTEPK